MDSLGGDRSWRAPSQPKSSTKSPHYLAFSTHGANSLNRLPSVKKKSLGEGGRGLGFVTLGLREATGCAIYRPSFSQLVMFSSGVAGFVGWKDPNSPSCRLSPLPPLPLGTVFPFSYFHNELGPAPTPSLSDLHFEHADGTKFSTLPLFFAACSGLVLVNSRIHRCSCFFFFAPLLTADFRPNRSSLNETSSL